MKLSPLMVPNSREKRANDGKQNSSLLYCISSWMDRLGVVNDVATVEEMLIKMARGEVQCSRTTTQRQ